MTDSKQVRARGLLILFVLALCVAADRLSKAWALTNLTHGYPQSFIPGFLRFTLTSNPGAAFSLGSQNGQVMGAVATILTLVILVWIVKRTLSDAPLPAVEQLGMGCLLGGAIGNLIDRYTRGQVTDFLEFTFMPFPVFNVADALIDVGIGCMFIAIYMCKNEASKNALEVSSQSTRLPTTQDAAKVENGSNCTRRDPNTITDECIVSDNSQSHGASFEETKSGTTNGATKSSD